VPSRDLVELSSQAIADAHGQERRAVVVSFEPIPVELPSPSGRAAALACVGRVRRAIAAPSPSRLGELASLWAARSALPG
jgi:hypothetical protein